MQFSELLYCCATCTDTHVAMCVSCQTGWVGGWVGTDVCMCAAVCRCGGCILGVLPEAMVRRSGVGVGVVVVVG